MKILNSKYLSDMKTSFNTYIRSFVFFVATISLLIASGCSKDDSGKLSEDLNVSLIKATIDTAIVTTKTQHSYVNKTLKTVWQEGDEIAVAGVNSAIFKYVQKGAILDNGHSADFFCDESADLQAGNIIAVYPYTNNLSFTIDEQSGKIYDLSHTDILLARQSLNNSSESLKLKFSPLCAILRLPKGLEVSDPTNTGNCIFYFHGDNVANGLSISKNGNISFNKGIISFSVSLSGGKLSEDIFICFIPQSTEDGYIYYMESEKGDKFELFKKDISTTKIYSVSTLSRGFVEFDDELFKDYCISKFDLNKDGQISLAEAKMVDNMYVNTKDYLKIVSYKGIESFKSLKVLEILGTSGSTLTSLDLSKNLTLSRVKLQSLPNLTNLVLSKSASLTTLILGDLTSLSNLNLYNNESLEILHITYGLPTDILSSLDLSKNTRLKELLIKNYLLSENLDLSKNTALANLTLSNLTELTSLDLTKNSSLTSLSLSGLSKVTSLNLSKNSSLTSLSLSGLSNVTSLDLSKNSSLTSLSLSGLSNVTSLDLSKNTQLKDLSIGENKFTNLDLSQNLALLNFNITNSLYLTGLDLSKNTKLNDLTCRGNKILSNIDVSGCVELLYFDCSNNIINSIDLTGCTSLSSFNCSSNLLNTLDVSKNLKLVTLVPWVQKIGEAPDETGPSTISVKKGQVIQYMRQRGSGPLTQVDKGEEAKKRHTTIIEVD